MGSATPGRCRRSSARRRRGGADACRGGQARYRGRAPRGRLGQPGRGRCRSRRNRPGHERARPDRRARRALHTIRVQAGVQGLELEEWLNERGYTFPHFPASVHLARVGGYLAARRGPASFRPSTERSRIWSCRWRWRWRAAISSNAARPAAFHGAGPEPGLHRQRGNPGRDRGGDADRPAGSGVTLVSCGRADVASGVDAIRAVLQRGWRPSVVRLHDAAATEANLGRVLDADVSGVVAIVGFDGPGSLVELEEREVIAGLAAAGGRTSARSWRSRGGRTGTRSTTRPSGPSCPRSGEQRTSLRRTSASFRPTRRLRRTSPSGTAGRPALHRPLLPLVLVGLDGLRPIRRRQPARRSG